MTPEDRSYITRLFARVLTFMVVFMIVSIIGGFVMARLMHLPVDVDKFYGLVGNAFYMILGAVVGFISGGKKG